MYGPTFNISQVKGDSQCNMSDILYACRESNRLSIISYFLISNDNSDHSDLGYPRYARYTCGDGKAIALVMLYKTKK